MGERTATRRRLLGAATGLALGAAAGCSGAIVGDGGDAVETPTDGRSGPTMAGSDGSDGDALDSFALRPAATGFSAPLDLAVDPATDRRYVADQTGVVSTFEPGGGVEPVLDLRERVVTDRSEQGLLGIALHPRFEENRRLYLRYSAGRRPGTPASFSHTFVLSEFTADDGTSIAPDSERPLVEIPQPQWNHNSGAIVFGPDGYLYVGTGDGGGSGDVGTGHADDWYDANDGGNGQDVTENLLGSILRIDVDERGSSASQTESDAVNSTDGNRSYGIPDDNPLVGRDGLDEQWAWGFRNPWRLSFDGGDCYVGDVGESAYEEVDLVRRGGNYGWNVKEGTHCFGADACPDETADGEPLIDPIVEYPHSGGPVSGVSVIGGYVYRGDGLPGISGAYVFGDLSVDGRLFVARPTSGDGLWPTATVPIVEADRAKLRQLLSFGRDPAGRLFALGRGGDGGAVYELRPGGG